MMTKIVLPILISAALAMPTSAQETGQAQAFQAARLGDNQMSCEALVGEINALTTQMTEAQNRMTEQAMAVSRNAMREASAPSGVSTAMGLAGMAAALVPGGGLAMGVAGGLAGAGQRAAMAAQQAQAQRDRETMLDDMQDGMALLGPISQRIDHLSDISRAKQC